MPGFVSVRPHLKPGGGRPHTYKPGDVFGRITVMGYAGVGVWASGRTAAAWIVKCGCGAENTVSTQTLYNCKIGRIRQCLECAKRDARRGNEPGVCIWCGCPANQATHTSIQCAACRRVASRLKRFPCGKPRRRGYPIKKPINEHQCTECDPWKKKKTG